MLLGNAGECATANIHLEDFELRAPIMKPNAQLSSAINELMIQKGDECRFYRITYRYVAFPIAIGARVISHRNIFNVQHPDVWLRKLYRKLSITERIL